LLSPLQGIAIDARPALWESAARLAQSLVELKLQRLDHKVGFEVFSLLSAPNAGFRRGNQ